MLEPYVKVRVIERLRERFGGTWKYVRPDRCWYSDLGFHVDAVSVDNGHGESVTMYRRSDTLEIFSLGTLHKGGPA